MIDFWLIRLYYVKTKETKLGKLGLIKGNNNKAEFNIFN